MARAVDIIEKMLSIVDAYPEEYVYADKACIAFILRALSSCIENRCNVDLRLERWAANHVSIGRMVTWASEWNLRVYRRDRLRDAEVGLLLAHSKCLEWLASRDNDTRDCGELEKLSKTLEDVVEGADIILPVEDRDIIQYFERGDTCAADLSGNCACQSTYRLTHFILAATDYLSRPVLEELAPTCEEAMEILCSRVILSSRQMELDEVFECLMLARWARGVARGERVAELMPKCLQCVPIDKSFAEVLLRLSLRSSGRLSCHRLLTFLPVVYGLGLGE